MAGIRWMTPAIRATPSPGVRAERGSGLTTPAPRPSPHPHPSQAPRRCRLPGPPLPPPPAQTQDDGGQDPFPAGCSRLESFWRCVSLPILIRYIGGPSGGQTPAGGTPTGPWYPFTAMPADLPPRRNAASLWWEELAQRRPSAGTGVTLEECRLARKAASAEAERLTAPAPGGNGFAALVLVPLLTGSFPPFHSPCRIAGDPNGSPAAPFPAASVQQIFLLLFHILRQMGLTGQDIGQLHQHLGKSRR